MPPVPKQIRKTRAEGNDYSDLNLLLHAALQMQCRPAPLGSSDSVLLHCEVVYRFAFSWTKHVEGQFDPIPPVRNGIFHISLTLSLVCYLTNWAATALGTVTNAGYATSILLRSFLSSWERNDKLVHHKACCVKAKKKMEEEERPKWDNVVRDSFSMMTTIQT